MPADLRYADETSRVQMTCRLEAGDWLYIPSGWWHIARTQAASVHLSIGIMPVPRLQLFAFLAHFLAPSPFWCKRLPLVHPAEAGTPASTVAEASAKQLWTDMRAQLQTILAQEQTFQAFQAYLVDGQRAQSIDRLALG